MQPGPPPDPPRLSVPDATLFSHIDLTANTWKHKANRPRASHYFASTVPSLPLLPPLALTLPVRYNPDPAPPQHAWPADVIVSDLLTLELEDIAQSMADISVPFMNESAPGKVEFLNLARQAVYAASRLFDENAALEWAEGFSWPDRDKADDLRDFHASGCSLAGLARSRIAAASANQLLTVERVHSTLHPSNPHLAEVLDVAGGVHITLPSNFCPNSTLPNPPPCSKAFLKLHSAVEKTYYATHGVNKLAIVLPLEVHKLTFQHTTQAVFLGPRSQEHLVVVPF